MFCRLCSTGGTGRRATRAGGVCELCWQDGKGDYVEPTEYVQFATRPEHYAPSMRDQLATDRHGNVRQHPNGHVMRQIQQNLPGPSGGFPVE